jgi:uncharacterized protein YqeY
VSLRERIQADLASAMRSGDSQRRDVLRMAWNGIYAVEKRERHELSDDEVVAALVREVKTRRESEEAFSAAGRDELAAPETAAIVILEEYLPQPLSDEELRALVDEAVAATGASSARDLGRVMGWLSPRTRGRADGRHVSELVARRLAQADLDAHDASRHEQEG